MIPILCRIGRVVAVAVLVTMCVATAAMAEVKVETVTYRGWGGSLRLSNGTVEVVVVPAVGRIMRYGFVGGPNLIWEDPLLSGRPADRVNFPRFGGNKAWPWPQDEWPAHIGHDWPPPPAADQAEFTASVFPRLAVRMDGSDTVRMRSPLVIGFGLYIVREIRLAPTGTLVTVTTRLEHAGVSASGPTLPVGAWSITPAPAPDTLLVHLTPDSTLPAHYKPLGSFDPFASLTVEDGILHVVRHPDKDSKIGIDGDRIGAVYGDTLWILTNKSSEAAPAGTATGYEPGERIQVYANANSAADAARGLPPYMELEMTSPKKNLAQAGDSVTLVETWELERLTAGADPRRALGR